MNKLTIKYKNGTEETLRCFLVSPTGTEMRNTSRGQLREVLLGDGRDLLYYQPGKQPRIIRVNTIENIILADGLSVLVDDPRTIHRCGVWCDKC